MASSWLFLHLNENFLGFWLEGLYVSGCCLLKYSIVFNGVLLWQPVAFSESTSLDRFKFRQFCLSHSTPNWISESKMWSNHTSVELNTQLFANTKYHLTHEVCFRVLTDLLKLLVSELECNQRIWFPFHQLELLNIYLLWPGLKCIHYSLHWFLMSCSSERA